MYEKGKHYQTGASEIWIDDEGIMRIIFAKNITLTLPDMQEAYALFDEFGFGHGRKKSRQLLTGGPFTVSREAREFAGKNGSDYFHAAAMVTGNVLMRYVINLFNALVKHDVPFKIFSNEEEALEWLRTFPKD